MLMKCLANRSLWTLFFAMLLSMSPGDSWCASDSRPKVLIFSAIDVDYLNDTLVDRGNAFGVNGFMLAYIGEWWSHETDLASNERRLKRLSELGTRCGLNNNFIKVALGYRAVPQWDDEDGWTGVERNIGAIAALARRTGLKGLAIDTENYDTKVWEAHPLRFKRTKKDDWRGLVRKRGAQLMHAIVSAYPDAETLLLQEGAYWWFQRRDEFYELWIDFYDGLASVRPAAGVVVATESTYSLTKAAEIRARVAEIRDSMSQHVQDGDYWKDHGSLAIGMWPVGKAYDDKSARYSVGAFEQQFDAATHLSSRYVWIYGHGAAWWQMTPEQLGGYARDAHWIWGAQYQAIPTIPLLDQYRRVFAPITVPTCNAFH